MSNDLELDLLKRVNAIQNFFGSVLLDDSLSDWQLAREFAEFLVRIGHQDLIGHLILAKAHRHLGDKQRAANELSTCRAMASESRISEMEAEVLLPILREEGRLLGEDR